MTGDLMGAAPADGPDPLDAQYVAPLVTYLASPAAENINGEVFVVHGGVARCHGAADDSGHVPG